MKAKSLPPLEYLNECFEVSEKSPSGLYWKVRPREHFPTQHGWNNTNSKRSGKIAGCFRDNGRGHQYYHLKINNKLFLVHRIVYSMYHNIALCEDIQIDHINGDGTNNKHSNIRIANGGQNACNSRFRKNNKSGTKGVCWDKSKNRWVVQVRVDGVNHRSCFICYEQACEYVCQIRPDLHKEFTNHG